MGRKVHELRLDPTQRLGSQSSRGHNRWRHPEIPPALRIVSGDEVVLDTIDALDCQIQPQHTVSDHIAWDLNAARPLTGPIWIECAAPGDLLQVELLDITPGRPDGPRSYRVSVFCATFIRSRI